MDCCWFIRKKKTRRKNDDVPHHSTSDLESEQERNRRWRSIRIIYFTMFMMSLGFSIILTGVWPFLDKLDPQAGKEFLGFVVAANPLGQMLFSPLFGYWGNRSGSIRAPLLLSMSLFIVSSAGYALLEAFPATSVKYWMVGTRFLVGVSSANIAVCRSYLSAATTLKERTGAISMVSLAQVLGFVVGPGVQALVTPLGDTGVPFLPGISLNMYTAAGWVNVFFSVVNLILFLPGIFSEQRIAAREAMRDLGAATEKETWAGTKPDYLSSWSLIGAFFILVFNFVLLETLGTSLVMDQFAWTKQEALYYMGLLMSVGAVVAVVTFVTIKPLCRWFDERAVMIYGGFVLMVLGRALYIPWGDSPPQLMISEEKSINGTEAVGCPVSSQPWCEYTPAMTVSQLLIGYGFTSIGYPIGVTLIQTLFSKILGPRPQGVWMGLMTGSGCFSRVLGPVFVSFVYVELGTVWTFSVTTVMMALCCLWLWLVYSRLTPPTPTQPPAPLIETKKSAADQIDHQELQVLNA